MPSDPCGHGARQNEDWALDSNGTITSLQPNTPFCLGAKGTAAGTGAVLDACGASSASWTVGFTKGSGKSGTIAQTSSGLCLTVSHFTSESFAILLSHSFSLTLNPLHHVDCVLLVLKRGAMVIEAELTFRASSHIRPSTNNTVCSSVLQRPSLQ